MISAGYMIRATYLAVTAVLQDQLKAYKLTSPQWHFMREIWMQEGLSQRELSDRVGTAVSTTVSALRVLERRGLIYRESISSDRRISRVYLTEAGRRMRNNVLPVIKRINKIAIEDVSQREMKDLERILAKIRRNLWQFLEGSNISNSRILARHRRRNQPVDDHY